MDQPYPILEFDEDRERILDPLKILKPADVSEACVVCFFQEVITGLVDSGQAQLAINSKSEIGPHPFYNVETDGRRFTVFHPGVGAPLGAALLEEAIAFGCRRFIACGGAGVLNRELTVGHVVVPIAAIREEGTSYHYMPPTREVYASGEAVRAIEKVLERHQIPYVVGRTWTNDAIYRETPGKIEKRRAEGCLTVEMEAAAFFAVARYHGVHFAQILYGGDDVSGKDWDARGWEKQFSTREKLFWIAAEAVLEL
ncbi:MAG: nucleoside phosphorylase [Anaerolineae bacterium]|nr:nucleoside phosphorylase [Anaerolineae bacterium]